MGMFTSKYLNKMSKIVSFNNNIYSHLNHSVDIVEFFTLNNIIFLTGEINDSLANNIINTILYQNTYPRKKNYKFYINSPGGSISSGLMIYDVMQFTSNLNVTVSLGLAASMGSFLLSSGTSNNR